MPDSLPRETPVLIIGAGPTGLMLACELALAGVVPTLIDSRLQPTGQSRALGFTVRTLEVFEQRGILDRFGDLRTQEAVHFAGLTIPASVLGSTHTPVSQFPQSKTEAVLTDWALSLGVEILRGRTATTLVQDHDAATVQVQSADGRSESVRARYVVGCDGARSTVRSCVGAQTATTPPSVQMLLADVRDCGLPDNPFGVKHEAGMVMSAPLGNGVDRIIVCERGAPLLESGRQVEFADVQRAYQAVVGTPLGDGECLWASSFTDAGSIVDSYRHGRVFLVGDSARTHLPAGGQGMNVAIQDAVNLGWKLAAAVHGHAPTELLDTYDRERRRVGQALLENTQAQGQLFLRGPEVDPLRKILAGLIQIPEVARILGRSVSGLDVRYDMGIPDAPSIVGRRLPPAGMQLKGQTSGVLSSLQKAHGVLLASAATVAHAQEAVVAWSDRVSVLPVVPEPTDDPDLSGVDALLVRPDGYVAWASPGAGTLESALRRWFGDPNTPMRKEQSDGQHPDRRSVVTT
ncbi:MAG TPA: FAD-dependent monooxygenase [Jatrophihabitans sp.]|jgi:bifunctional hydroxylase/dehydrase|uniref:FAD-dependent monooxygenase n=1 Tax=Jatrophihabitans sp. TaxID=1932789 RepID=UPI002F0F3511